MVQEIIVYIIGIAVAILLISKIIKAVFGEKQKQGFGCSNCSCSVNNGYTNNRIRN